MSDDTFIEIGQILPATDISTQETREHVHFVFDLLDDLNKRASELNGGFECLTITEVQTIINNHVQMKDPKFSNRGQRITHFILYLNTDLKHCSWVKTDPMLNLRRYVRGKTISSNTYYKIVNLLDLKVYMEETIMYTPYAFCRDLVEITLNKIKTMDAMSQLIASENLILALMKSIKYLPLETDLETSLLSHFNQTMLVFGENNLPNDVRRIGYEVDQKEILKYNGYRVKSIFTIFVEVIQIKNNSDDQMNYPLYELKLLHNNDTLAGNNSMFKKCMDVIMHKCVNMCHFSVDTWLSWYEVEVLEEDTNLQTAIGHMCFKLCRFIDDGSIDEPILKDFKPVLRNIAIEKIDFTGVNMNKADEIIEQINCSNKYNLNDWIKKLIDIPDIFINHKAIQVLDDNMESIDYNCFKCVIDRCMVYYKHGGLCYQSMGDVLFKGIDHLDTEDKMSILKHIVAHFPDNTICLCSNFDEVLSYIINNEYNNSVAKKELLSKLVWLVIQQPRKMLHTLISQHVSGICGLPVKAVDSKTFSHKVLAHMHLHMDACYIYREYSDWLDIKIRISEVHKQNLHRWILQLTRLLHLMKPTQFLANVITPLLNPSSNYDYTLYLVDLMRFFITECQLMTVHENNVWDKLLVTLARVLDDARWNLDNYSPVRVKLCEKIILTLKHLLQYTNFIVKPKDFIYIKQELSVLHLMTRSHFLCLWTDECITVDGMDEQFIMTVQSQSHISYANLNSSSTQRSQEEFIFSIATFMPKFTWYEMKSFLENYLYSAKNSNIVKASFFLVDCVMNALMRIIVYLKTALPNKSCDNGLCWDYLENTIVNFLQAANDSSMCKIYDEEVDVTLAFSIITKTIMVIKQLDNSRQPQLLNVVCRIIDVISGRLDPELILKLLALIASMKTPNSKEILRTSVDELLQNLKAQQASNKSS